MTRVLYLRTFNDVGADEMLLSNLARRLGPETSIEITGDLRERSGAPFESALVFTPTTNADWRRVVIGRILEADAILLHISPKDLVLPQQSFAGVATGLDWEEFTSTALTLPTAGSGLLREICYLNRLRRLDRTIVLCHQRYHEHIDSLIALAGMIGDAFDRDGRPLTPRLTAMDKQVGFLAEAHCGVTYAESTTGPMPALVAELTAVLRELPPVDLSGPPDLGAFTGASADRRRLPPDQEWKIIRHTAVEDLFFIPSGELTEISAAAMTQVLTAGAAAIGCPHCRAPLNSMFFYTRGLSTGTLGPDDWPNARCQRCGRKSSLFGNELAPQ